VLVCDIQFGVWHAGSVPRIMIPIFFFDSKFRELHCANSPTSFENLNAENKESLFFFQQDAAATHTAIYFSDSLTALVIYFFQSNNWSSIVACLPTLFDAI
jgi:hypothetical protein